MTVTSIVLMIRSMIILIITFSYTSPVLVVYIYCLLIMAQTNKPVSISNSSVKLLTWNSTGIMSSSTYLARILDCHSIDICGLSEHWLFNTNLHFLQTINCNYKCFSVSDADLLNPSRRKVGKGGVALFWKRELDKYISLLDIDDDRLVGIEYQVAKEYYMYVIQMYLPSTNHCMQDFKEYMQKLQDLCSVYSNKGILILMGDFNAHQNGSSCFKRYDSRSVILRDFLAFNNLVSINSLPICTGANSTFVSYTGEFKSMIDHIALPAEYVDTVRVCHILDDGALNVSTHRPIFCDLDLPHAGQADLGLQIDTKYSIKWRMMKSEDINKYKECIETACVSLYSESNNCNTREDIDELYESIKQVISSVSLKCLKRSSEFKPFLKPYWDNELKLLHKSMKICVIYGLLMGGQEVTLICRIEITSLLNVYLGICTEKMLKNI